MIYEYKCLCGQKFEKVRPHWESHKKGRCPKCLCMAPRILSNPLISTGKGYRFPGICNSLDKKPIYVKSKTHFRELCRERNLTPVGLD